MTILNDQAAMPLKLPRRKRPVKAVMWLHMAVRVLWGRRKSRNSRKIDKMVVRENAAATEP